MMIFSKKKALLNVEGKVVLFSIGFLAGLLGEGGGNILIPLLILLLLVIAGCAILGSYIGNCLMHFKLQQKDVKKLMGVILFLLAMKLFYQLFII